MEEKFEYLKYIVEDIPKDFLEEVNTILFNNGLDWNFNKLVIRDELTLSSQANNCSDKVLKRAMLISVLFAINVAYHSNSERININEYIAKIEKYLPHFNGLRMLFFVSQEDKQLSYEISKFILLCLEKTMDWGKKEIENVASIFIKHGVMDHTTGCNLIRDEEQKVSSFQRPNFQQRSKRTTATYSPMSNYQATIPVSLNMRVNDYEANFQCTSKDKFVISEAIQKGCTQNGRTLPHLQVSDSDTAEKVALKCQYTLNNSNYKFPAIETETDREFSLVLVRAESK